MMKRGRKVQYKDDDHKDRRLYAREWCKKCESETGQDYAIFETVIEIQVLDYGEVKRRLALDSVMGIMGYGSYRDKDALEWLQKSQEEEK